MKGYVTYQGRRWHVTSTWIAGDCDTATRMLRLKPFRGPEVIAQEAACKPWKRKPGHRIARGQIPHRGRPIIIELHADERIEVRQKGRRQRYACTFGGLYDLLARQEVLNKRNARAKHIGRKP